MICNKSKPLLDFYYRKDSEKYNNKCKDCIKEYKKNWHINNKELNNARSKEYYENNKEESSRQSKEYAKTHRSEISLNKKNYYENNKDRIKEYNKKYRNEEDRERKRQKRRIWVNNKIKNVPSFRLKLNVSRHISLGLKASGGSKMGKSVLEFLPYSFEQLKQHLESLFEPWMTWSNWGKYNPATWNDNDQSNWTWQIDHIIPHSTFQYTSMDDENFQKCWALSNLRPLSAKQNFLDGVKRARHN